MSAGVYGMSGGGNGMNVGYVSAPVVYDGVYGHQTAGGGMVQQHGGDAAGLVGRAIAGRRRRLRGV